MIVVVVVVIIVVVVVVMNSSLIGIVFIEPYRYKDVLCYCNMFFVVVTTLSKANGVLGI